MIIPRALFSGIIAALVPLVALSSSSVSGEARVFVSPNGVQEQCVMLSRIPGGVYTEKDQKTEKAFCSLDLHSDDIAVCPKLFSTSPGTLIFDISRGPAAGEPREFERTVCPQAGTHIKLAGPPVSFKTTMNARETSATFSTSSLLYYHFSRYFNTFTHVPPSVFRTMDREVHFERVTQPGVRYSADNPHLRMNHAAWRIMEKAEAEPSAYAAADELFTPDHRQMFGILIQPRGKRYSAAINGTRESGWGEGQNRDFQETAPFLALRSEKALAESISEGISKARHNSILADAMGTRISPAQMVFWMQELIEIVLLDFIFSQQDRIGNIDFTWHWYWLQDDEVRHQPAHGKTPPESLVPFNPVRLMRTELNDNDAGGEVQYANYAKSTGMLENLRHFNADTYRQLMHLDADLRNQGALSNYVQTAFGLNDRQVKQIVTNTRLAAEILRNTCRQGKMRFDLDPVQFFQYESTAEQSVDCDAPG